MRFCHVFHELTGMEYDRKEIRAPQRSGGTTELSDIKPLS